MEPAVRPAPDATPVPAADPLAAAQAASWQEAEGQPFLHDGQWYARRGHTLLQWDPTASTWDVARATGAAVGTDRPRFTSLRTPAIWLYVLLGLFAGFTLIGLGADGVVFSAFDRRAGGDFVSAADRDGALAFFYAIKVLQYLAFLGTAGVFIWWTRRATCNVRALGAAKPEFSPGWSVGWWFIPFANWVQPLRVLNQAWRASDPNLPARETDEWRRARLTPLLPIWWVLYLVGNAAWGTVWPMIDEESMSDRDIADLTAAVLALDIVMLAVTGLAIWVVAALTRRQDRANARFERVSG